VAAESEFRPGNEFSIESGLTAGVGTTIEFAAIGAAETINSEVSGVDFISIVCSAAALTTGSASCSVPESEASVCVDL
jgi:hypothetical protein